MATKEDYKLDKGYQLEDLITISLIESLLEDKRDKEIFSKLLENEDIEKYQEHLEYLKNR